MVDFTVVIPTYNGGERLSLVLERLKMQTGTEEIDWEILVIDNNSTDETAKIVQKYQKNWPYSFPLAYFFEAEQGLAFARGRGVKEAKGDYIGFLDDDNIPDCDWVFQAYQFGKTHSQAGAYGGQIRADFASEPPENIEKIIGFLAIRERGDRANLYQPEVLSLPPGAGLVIRTRVWRDLVPDRLVLSGRSGQSLICGSDWEPLLYMHKAGWEIWYNPDMKITHKIPAKRLQRDYLLSLIRGSCLPFCFLRMMVAKTWKKPFIIARMILGNLYKAGLYYLKNHQQIKSSLIAECELYIYLSRIASVFYYFNQKIRGV